MMTDYEWKKQVQYGLEEALARDLAIIDVLFEHGLMTPEEFAKRIAKSRAKVDQAFAERMENEGKEQ